MKPLLSAYRVLATVVGLSIITLIVIGVPLKYVHEIWPHSAGKVQVWIGAEPEK